MRKCRKWINYRNRNTVDCCDCQVVSAVNAYYYLTGKIVPNKRYDKFIDLCACRSGSAIHIEKVWNKLGIKIINSFKRIDLNPTNISKRLPLEARVWHPHYGFHSVLIVQYEPITNSYRIANFCQETTTDGWMYAQNFRLFLDPDLEWCKCESKRPYHRTSNDFHQFGLK